MGCSQWIDWSGTWKELDWKIGGKDIWGISMWIVLYKWAKSVKILIFHVNINQKVTSGEEEFNNQIDNMTFCGQFPAIHVIPNEQSGHGGRHEVYAWAQQHELPLSMADQATVLLSASSANTRSQH